jgi:tetratricopeptide (TPR) repeat protein
MPLFRRRSKDTAYQQAASLLAEGKPEEAVNRLRIIVEENPGHINARVSLAIGLMQMQESPTESSELTKEAFANLDLAEEMEPDNPVPPFNRGVMLRHLGLKKEALACFDRVLEIEDRNALAILHKAEINYELENWEEAIELARLALIRDPGLEEAVGWVRVAMRKAGLLEDESPVERKPE